MAINNKTLATVQADLVTAGTTEVTFKNALSLDVTKQVDTNEIDIRALEDDSRGIELTGDVTGSVTYTLDDATKALQIATTITGMSIDGGADIQAASITNDRLVDGTIENGKIKDNTITPAKIASTNKVRVRIINAAGTTLRQFDGLTV